MNLFVVLAGPRDFLRGPDWASVDFLSPPFQFLLGLILAIVVIAGFFRGALLLLGLIGADRHKARGVGEGMIFILVAIFVAITFQDLFGSFLAGMA